MGDLLYSQQYFSANYKQKDLASYFFDYPINISQILTSDYWDDDKRALLQYQTSHYPDQDKCASAANFSEFVEGLVGPLLASEFFRVYPEKVWGVPATSLLPDWAPKRIRRTHLQEPFFGDQYCGVSRSGTGFLFKRIVDLVRSKGSQVNFNSKVMSLETRDDKITSINFQSHSITVHSDEFVISTLPITVLSRLLGHSFDLDFRGIASVYLGYENIKSIIPDPYHWLYFSDPDIIFNRITEPTKLCSDLNLSENSNRTYLIAETTYSLSDFTHLDRKTRF